MISKDKKYKTRCGFEVHLFGFFEGYWYGRCKDHKGQSWAARWFQDGHSMLADSYDLVEVDSNKAEVS
mgnify:CR=1 FL=1